MRISKLTITGIAMAMLLPLWGCSSNLDSGESETTPTTNQQIVQALGFVGSDKCIGCHEKFSWSGEAVTNYLAGPHVIHSDHITAASVQTEAGQPECLSCHDPIGDGRLIEGKIDAANVPADGLAAVGCENCHGTGKDHYGVGPMPTANPDFNACGQCHDSSMYHNAYHPEGDNILEDYVASPHADSGDRPEAVCARCHTDEGGRLYRNVNSVSRLESVVMPVENASAIQCRTCHNAHNPSKLLMEEVTSSHGTVVDASAEFATCTNCHQRPDAQFELDGAGDPVVTQLDGSTSSDGASGDMIYHATRYTRVIASSHYDNPATSYKSSQLLVTDPSYAPNIIEGYTMDPVNERVCRDCHNVHASDVTVNKQWARSGHGGNLLEAKEAVAADSHSVAGAVAYRAAGVDGDTAPWPHYDWDASNRQSCQRCHTATGAKNFMADPAGYDAANNDFSHLVGWSKAVDGTVTSSGQNELLYCWGCHANNSGTLRNPGAITEIYEGTVAAPLVTVAYPDVAGSNVCMSCHLGRETGAVVTTKTGFDNLGFVNSHYLAAGGSVFGQTGYAFGDRDYAIPAGDTHVMLGRGTTGNATVDADYTNGPCITCHFGSNDGSHTLSPFTEYAAGDVALNPVCVNCHSSRGAGSNAAEAWFGEDFTLVDLVAGTVAPHKGRYLAALEALNQALIVKGFTFTSGYPYFAAKNWLSAGDTDITGAVTGKNNMGAAFNYNLLIHEPGGVAHNRRYTRRLIYDSIDWMDNGALDYSVGATLLALSDTVAYKASALSYLVNRGDADVNVGTAAERF